MKVKTIEKADLEIYLAVAANGEWPRELVIQGFFEPDCDRGYIYFDQRLTGPCWMNPRRTKFLGAWRQIERIASEYSRSSPTPGWFARKDWEFIDEEEIPDEFEQF